MWKEITPEPETIKDIKNLPLYSFEFFFKNLHPFKFYVLLLTLAGIFSTILRFANVYLLSEVITKLFKLEYSEIFYIYLPACLGTSITMEILDYYRRKYAEALPLVYKDYLSLRFYRTILKRSNNLIFTVSRERIVSLVERYVRNVSSFIHSWSWDIVDKITEFFLIGIILGIQSKAVLLTVTLYLALFLFISFKLSKKFAKLAGEFAAQSFTTESSLSRFSLYLPNIKRLGLESFFVSIAKSQYGKQWDILEKVRGFHATRWFLQLNLFSLLALATIFFGVYQVKLGVLSVGFLLLIKYAFDKLWLILVFFIEYYVLLVREKEEARIIREDISLLLKDSEELTNKEFEMFESLVLNNVQIEFSPSIDKKINIKVDKLLLNKGDKIGIIGKSGSGKTTISNVIMNLLPFQGELLINNQKIQKEDSITHLFSVVNNTDPLFLLNLEENIKLGSKDTSLNAIEECLTRVGAESLIPRLNEIVGTKDFSLSAGEEQRVRLARALLFKPQILILDEPFNGIDIPTKEIIIDNIKIYYPDITILLITHSPDELRLIDRVYKLSDFGEYFGLKLT